MVTGMVADIASARVSRHQLTSANDKQPDVMFEDVNSYRYQMVDLAGLRKSYMDLMLPLFLRVMYCDTFAGIVHGLEIAVLISMQT